MPPDLPNASTPSETLPCAGIRVVDATDEYGAYAARLLADLGADVVRVVPRGIDPLDASEPRLPGGDDGTGSAFAWFVNLNKRSVHLDLTDDDDLARFLAMVSGADLLLESWTTTMRDTLTERIVSARPDLIRVSITPFGDGGPRTDRAATDLTTLASGGLLALGGYPDAEPVAAHGGQSLLAASIFGAVAGLVGLLARRRDGRGRRLDVSAQEAIAAALEDAIPQFDLTGRVRRRSGGDPREAGTGILACKDGYVSMVAGRLGTARAWQALSRWLVEAGVDGAEELTTDAWTSFPYRQRPESIARFQEIFERFAADRTRDELYLEGQRRSIAIAPVNAIADVLDDPQLRARDFFRLVHDPSLGRDVLVPGRPYRLAGDAGPVPVPMHAVGDIEDIWSEVRGADEPELETLGEGAA